MNAYNFKWVASSFAKNNMSGMSVGSLIPIHYKSDVNDYLKIKGVLKGMVAFAAIQFLVAILFFVFKSGVVAPIINISIGVYAILCIYIIRFFKSFENYINATLSGYYFFVFAFALNKQKEEYMHKQAELEQSALMAPHRQE